MALLLDLQYYHPEQGWDSFDPEGRLGLWSSYWLTPHPVDYVDNRPGIHAFAPEIDISATVLGGPAICVPEYRHPADHGKMIRVSQHVSITAVNAAVHFSYEGVGRVYTPHPAITLYRALLVHPSS